MALTIQQLAPLVGSDFTLHTHRGPVALRLAEAVERKRGGLPARFATPLSLLFRAPEGVQLTQAAYALEHPALGAHEWMLVPVLGPEGEPGSHYEVVLSQLTA